MQAEETDPMRVLLDLNDDYIKGYLTLVIVYLLVLSQYHTLTVHRGGSCLNRECEQKQNRPLIAHAELEFYASS